MTTTTKKTADEIHAMFAEEIPKLDAIEVHIQGVIEDYPIGGSNRGKCRLYVESNKRGWRTLKQTTDKRGRWCNPKASTYSETGGCYVVSGDVVDRDFQWMTVTIDGVSLVSATYVQTELVPSPFSSNYVRREASHGIPADAPDVIAAWDEWISGIKAVKRMMDAKFQQTQMDQLAG